MNSVPTILFAVVLSMTASLTLANPPSQHSTCYGTTSKGKLTNGVELPDSGTNFTNYSTLARIMGRTYVHSKVSKIILDAYHALESEQPEKVFMYAETGFEDGGKFKPHKTHQNGLSVDFMTPVVDRENNSTHLPTHPFNKFGYDIEFDKNGVYEDLRIDYEALAAHIVALDKAAKENGVGLWRVIFDPQLRPNLFKTKYGAYIKENITFLKNRAWVRHDEHYHVDFAIPCKKL